MGSGFLILAAFFTLGTHPQAHIVFHRACMIALDLFLCFTAAGFLLRGDMPKSLAVLGFAASLFHIVTQYALTGFSPSEWIFLLLLTLYAALVAGKTEILSGEKRV